MNLLNNKDGTLDGSSLSLSSMCLRNFPPTHVLAQFSLLNQPEALLAMVLNGKCR